MTLAQHDVARAHANEVRRSTAEARWRVAAQPTLDGGLAVLADELESGRVWPRHLRVVEVLAWPRRSGPVMQRRLLRGVGLSESRKVGELTVRERGVLVLALRSGLAGRAA